MNTNKLLTSGEVARQAGVSKESMRYYERMGLLPEPQRSEARYRLYTEAAVSRLRFIKKAQHLGFSLDEIKDLLVLNEAKNEDAGQVKRLAESKLEAIDLKIKELEAMRTSLNNLVLTCGGEHTARETCPILQELAEKITD